MRVRLVAIVGGSGSGKTWLVRRLKRRLGAQAGVLSLDDFYRDLSHLPLRRRARTNFDHPAAIEWRLFSECLRRIKRGEAALLPRYDFSTHARRPRPRRWLPRPVVLLDGLWLLHRRTLRRLYALSIFADCPEVVRLERRIKRDQRERGRSRASIFRQYREQVAPMHARFVERQKRWASMVLVPEAMRDAVRRLTQTLLCWAANPRRLRESGGRRKPMRRKRPA